MPPPAFESEFDLIALHYNLSLFAPMLQLLREESPVFMYWFDEMNAGLQTHLEPTGEEEHVPG